MSVPMCVKHSSPVLDFESRAVIFSTATSHLAPWLTVYLNLQTGKVSGQGSQLLWQLTAERKTFVLTFFFCSPQV